LELTITPRCNLCHHSATGGDAIATKFGSAMLARGLAYGNDASVATALARMETDNVDSVGDGTDDIQRLRDGMDPSTGKPLDGIAAGTCSGSTVPEFGCLARVAPSPSRASSVAVLAALSAVFVARARKRARRGLDARRATREHA
jgi:hypothetical protein